MRKVLVLILPFLSFSAQAGSRSHGLPIWLQDNNWQQVQQQHLQTQQQLQAQDQYRRQLLQQDQERQIQRLKEQQDRLEGMQRSLLIHDHSNRLRMYSRPIKLRPEIVNRKDK